jgi:large subunit ribosomal protein L22
MEFINKTFKNKITGDSITIIDTSTFGEITSLTQLTFSRRRIAGDVKKCLQSAIANAENNLNMSCDVALY